MIRSLIMDDEAPARQRLRRLLAELGGVEVVAEAENGITALELIAKARPDVAFLDIDVPELDGLAVARALPTERPDIIFVTAYDEHAAKAFELAAVDYLVKPISRDRLASALARVREQRRPLADLDGLLARLGQASGPRRMAVRCGAKYIVFDPTRVSAVIARDHYSAILVDGKELLADDSLDTLEQRLSPAPFLRVHRSALINLTFLKELVHEGDRKYVAVLSDEHATRVVISRDRLPLVRERLGLEP